MPAVMGGHVGSDWSELEKEWSYEISQPRFVIVVEGGITYFVCLQEIIP